MSRSFRLADIRAITWDLDDTLWPLKPVIVAAEQAQWRWLNRHYPRFGGAGSNERVHALREELLLEHPRHAVNVTWLRRRILELLAREQGMGPEETRALVDGAFEAFIEARNRIRFHPDARDTIERLQTRFRQAAISNGNADIERIGLMPPLEFCQSPANGGPAKPDRRIFLAAAERLQLEPGQILHVGDSLEADVEGAAAAGLRSAWLDHGTGEETTSADLRVTSLSELADLLLGPAGSERDDRRPGG